jgi:hypothetical protein
MVTDSSANPGLMGAAVGGAGCLVLGGCGLLAGRGGVVLMRPTSRIRLPVVVLYRPSATAAWCGAVPVSAYTRDPVLVRTARNTPVRPQHRAAPVQHRYPQVRLGAAGITQPPHPAEQAEEGLLHHVLRTGLVADQQQRHPGQPQRMPPVQVLDELP